jgi:phosphatidylglycerol---prolipoprotein diacylglyceryl transferase
VKPVLISLAGFPISSFGVFLSISIVLALFFIWRIIRVYELDEEKVIDLFILTVLSGFVFSRLYFVLFHPNQFVELGRIFLINRYPGLPFWGGFLGGVLVLKLLSKRYRMNFWQIADFAVVGLFIAMAITSLGCLLGACQYGVLSSSPFAVAQAGIIGKRFPLQIIESLVFFVGFLYLSANALRFHFFGQIFSQGLIYLGISKFILEFFRGDTQTLYGPISCTGQSLGAIYIR